MNQIKSTIEAMGGFCRRTGQGKLTNKELNVMIVASAILLIVGIVFTALLVHVFASVLNTHKIPRVKFIEAFLQVNGPLEIIVGIAGLAYSLIFRFAKPRQATGVDFHRDL